MSAVVGCVLLPFMSKPVSGCHSFWVKCKLPGSAFEIFVNLETTNISKLLIWLLKLGARGLSLRLWLFSTILLFEVPAFEAQPHPLSLGQSDSVTLTGRRYFLAFPAVSFFLFSLFFFSAMSYDTEFCVSAQAPACHPLLGLSDAACWAWTVHLTPANTLPSSLVPLHCLDLHSLSMGLHSNPSHTQWLGLVFRFWPSLSAPIAESGMFGNL